MDLPEWHAHEARIDAAQTRDGAALPDRLSAEFVETLSPLECLALTHDPAAYLRPRQITPEEGDWLVTVFLCGRGFGKISRRRRMGRRTDPAGTPNQAGRRRARCPYRGRLLSRNGVRSRGASVGSLRRAHRTEHDPVSDSGRVATSTLGRGVRVLAARTFAARGLKSPRSTRGGRSSGETSVSPFALPV